MNKWRLYVLVASVLWSTKAASLDVVFSLNKVERLEIFCGDLGHALRQWLAYQMKNMNQVSLSFRHKNPRKSSKTLSLSDNWWVFSTAHEKSLAFYILGMRVPLDLKSTMTCSSTWFILNKSPKNNHLCLYFFMSCHIWGPYGEAILRSRSAPGDRPCWRPPSRTASCASVLTPASAPVPRRVTGPAVMGGATPWLGFFGGLVEVVSLLLRFG